MKYHLPVLYGISADPKADLKRADGFLSRALALDPNNAAAHNSSAWILMEKGRFEESLAEQEQTLALDPADVNAMLGMGWNYFNLGQFQKSVDIFDKAVRLSPHEPGLDNFLHGKAQAYFALKQYDQAIDWARRAIAVGEANPRPRATLTATLALTGHEAEAREALEGYTALPATAQFRTIAAFKAFDARSKNSNPGVLDSEQRMYDGLRKAGMAEQ
jgi:tetratricopeptide (TPR) repeat protein